MSMTRLKKLSSSLLAILLAVNITLFSGCTPTGKQISENKEIISDHRSQSQNVENGPEEQAENKEIHIYMEGDHALQEILQGFAAEGSINASFSQPARGQDYLEALTAALASDAPPDLFWLRDLNALQSLPQGQLHNIAEDASTPLIRAMGTLVPEFYDDTVEYGTLVPVGYYAEGYLANISLLAALLNTEDKIALQRDIIACSWEEWNDFVIKIEAYLQRPGGIQIILNENRYITSGYRPQSAQQVRGIFAVPDGDASALIGSALGSTLGIAYQDLNELNADDASDKQIILQPTFETLYRLLDIETMYMVRTGSAAYRGEEYALGQPLSAQQAREQLTGGTALFYRADSKTGAQILAEGRMREDELFMVPIKYPTTAEDTGSSVDFSDIFGEVDGEEAALDQTRLEQLQATIAGILDKNNRHLWYASDGYLCINANSGATEAAEQLLFHLFTSREGMEAIWQDLGLQPFTDLYPRGLLQTQLLGTATGGESNLLPGAGASLQQASNVIGAYVQQELLNKGAWGEEERVGFVNRCLAVFGLAGISGDAGNEP